jgi:Domain of unknown function (DUF4214)
MKPWHLFLVAAAMTAAGSLQAAGAIKPYTNRAAFAADDAVDWGGLTSLAGGDKGVNISPTFTGLPSGLGNVLASGKVPATNLKRFNEAISFFGNFTGGDRLLSTLPGGAGPLTLTFSVPVFGAGLQIESVVLGAFTGQIKAFDAAGNLLGQVIVSGIHTGILPADNTAPYMGIRSSLKEIVRLEIDTPNISGFAVNRLDVALTPSPILNSSFFITQLYQDLLNRPPGTTELVAGLATLTTGTLSDVALTVYTSPEFHANANYLTKCYLALLGRDPDMATWTPIFKLMQGGAQQLTTLSGFLGTPEYQAAYPATLPNPAFVVKLYQNLLGRAPEPGGLAYWTFVLNLGIPRAYVLNGFLTSPEYDARMAHRVDANLMYMSFLRRAGEPAGLNFWTVTMDFGVPLKAVMGGFVGSPEYFARF